MPKDIKWEFLMGPRTFNEITENLEIIINALMADDGSVPMDLGNVGTHDAKTTQSDSDRSNSMSYDEVCTIAWKGYKARKRTGKKAPNGPGTWHRVEGSDEWTSGRGDDGGKKGDKKGSKGGKPDKDKGGTGNRGKGKGKGKSETRYCCDCGEQGHIGVNCLYKWANSKDEEEDQGSLCESKPGRETAEELASLEAPDDEGEWSWPRIARWRKRMDPRPAFHCFAEDDENEQVFGESSGHTKRWRSSVDVEGSHRCGRLVDGGERDAEEHVSRSTHRGSGKVQAWKRVQRTRRRAYQELLAASRVRQNS